MLPDPAEPLTVTERNVFGANARRHPVTGIPLEQGHGALPEKLQAAQHLKLIEEAHGKAAADAVRKRLEQ